MSNTTRIAKNTLMLYFRQILIMLVSLYTVRIKLEMLGVEDFGIYNIVAGFVVMFSFLNGAMAGATQRFMNFAMGQNDSEKARNIYSISFIIHIIIAVIVVFLAETIGLWFFYKILNIPQDRQSVAFIVYQFSIALTVIGIITIPYRATIIANEKMSFFALLSIFEVLLKLAAVYLLTVILFDKLIVYSFFIFIIGIFIFLIHKIYCNKMFETAHFRYIKDNALTRQLVEFSGWSLFGEFTYVCRTHGTNVILNIFHGVTLNAAMGIATQVNNAIYTFVSNFQTAFRPQITKSYAAKDYDYFFRLIYQTSKISFFLLFIFALPLYINTDFVLNIWLKDVPEYSIIFTQLILINSLELTFGGTIVAAIQAAGNLKKYQIITSCIAFSEIPLVFVFLWFGISPIIIIIIKIILDFIIFIWRIIYLKFNVNLPILKYIREVILPVVIITVISCSLNIFISSFFINWSRLIISCITSITCIVPLVYFFGLNSQEKKYIKNLINQKILLNTKENK